MKLGIPLSIKLAKLLVLSIILTCFILPSNYLRARALLLSLEQDYLDYLDWNPKQDLKTKLPLNTRLQLETIIPFLWPVAWPVFQD